jgi:sugar/nucleoside kinase (ribokinase family)
MLGMGGIGSGMFFALNGNHTLGREESRSGRFLARRDYCKLHIISHYVQTLLGPCFTTIPIGKVGDDEVGKQLLAEMQAAGLDVRYVRVSAGNPTLFSFCFIYPDGSGGNLTTDDSACARVDAAFVSEAEPEFARWVGRGIALAAPEVPMPARRRMLELGSQYRFLRVASFAAEEIASAIDNGTLEHIDVLALNLDEAAAAAGVSSEAEQPAVVAAAAVDRLHALQPALRLAITAGRRGSWTWDGTSLVHLPAAAVAAVSTAGAGDAYLAGMLAGLVAGLSLSQAQELATLTAALSVTSPHTINPLIDRPSLYTFAAQAGFPICEAVMNLLEV